MKNMEICYHCASQTLILTPRGIDDNEKSSALKFQSSSNAATVEIFILFLDLPLTMETSCKERFSITEVLSCLQFHISDCRI